MALFTGAEGVGKPKGLINGTKDNERGIDRAS